MSKANAPGRDHSKIINDPGFVSNLGVGNRTNPYFDIASARDIKLAPNSVKLQGIFQALCF